MSVNESSSGKSTNDGMATLDGNLSEHSLLGAARRSIDAGRLGAADSLHAAADRLHHGAENIPGTQAIANAANGAADRLDATADYLRSHDSKAMAGGVMDYVRKHPGQSLAAAAILGFVTARAMRRA